MKRKQSYKQVIKDHFCDLPAATESTVNQLRYAILIQQKEDLIISLESFIDRLKRLQTLES